MQTINVKTGGRTDMVEITSQVKEIISQSGVESGICILFVPHTTSAITISEFSDPAVPKDILKETNKIVPFEDDYAHQEGNSAAHIKSSLFNFSLELIIDERKPILGAAQGIFFCEFDGPRDRKVYVKIIAG